MRFGVNYTPSTGWFHHWLDFDLDSVRTDLDSIAALGLDPIRDRDEYSVLTDLLRGNLGFTGLAITDALEMRAISATVGVEDGAVRALAAGADALCGAVRLWVPATSLGGVESTLERRRRWPAESAAFTCLFTVDCSRLRPSAISRSVRGRPSERNRVKLWLARARRAMARRPNHRKRAACRRRQCQPTQEHPDDRLHPHCARARR